MLRPKLMVIGHAQHGKDTVCEYLAEHGYKFTTSSYVGGLHAVWPKMQAGGPEAGWTYDTFEEAFADRANHRAFWFDAIAEFNTPDLTRLGRTIYASYDIYCGCRSAKELAAMKEVGQHPLDLRPKIIDFIIWVDRLGYPKEDRSSCTVEPFQADHILHNNGTLEDLKAKVDRLYHGFLKPWEDRLINPAPTLPGRATQVLP